MLEAHITITPTRTATRQAGSHYGYDVRCEACPRELGRWRLRPDIAARVHNKAVHGGELAIVRDGVEYV
jgi:hypothetical protein